MGSVLVLDLPNGLDPEGGLAFAVKEAEAVLNHDYGDLLECVDDEHDAFVRLFEAAKKFLAGGA